MINLPKQGAQTGAETFVCPKILADPAAYQIVVMEV